MRKGAKLAGVWRDSLHMNAGQTKKIMHEDLHKPSTISVVLVTLAVNYPLYSYKCIGVFLLQTLTN